LERRFCVIWNDRDIQTMPIRLAQARLIRQDSYVPTHLSKSPCRSAPPLSGGTSHRMRSRWGRRPSHQGKDAETPTETEGNLTRAGTYPKVPTCNLCQPDRHDTNIVGKPGEEPDLTDAGTVDDFFSRRSPEYVFVAAGKSGGIEANFKVPG